MWRNGCIPHMHRQCQTGRVAGPSGCVGSPVPYLQDVTRRTAGLDSSYQLSCCCVSSTNSRCTVFTSIFLLQRPFNFISTLISLTILLTTVNKCNTTVTSVHSDSEQQDFVLYVATQVKWERSNHGSSVTYIVSWLGGAKHRTTCSIGPFATWRDKQRPWLDAGASIPALARCQQQQAAQPRMTHGSSTTA